MHTGSFTAAVTLAALLTLSSSIAHAAPDPKQGRQLYEEHCTQCHIRLMGGDGSTIHTRKDRIIKNRTALEQRVAFCATQINAHLFPEDEAAVVAYLNEAFYKFK